MGSIVYEKWRVIGMNHIDRLLELDKEIAFIKGVETELNQHLRLLEEHFAAAERPENIQHSKTMNIFIREQAQRPNKPTIRF